MSECFHSSFESVAGGVPEHFFTLYSVWNESFESECKALLERYECELAAYGCSVESEFLLRFHLSDVTNQSPALYRLLAGRNSFISVVGQSPANGSRLALEAWHVPGIRKEKVKEHAFCCQLENYKPLLSEGEDQPSLEGSYEQTAGEFASLESLLGEYGTTIASSVARTWLYCRDVDNNYKGLVLARNACFDRIGLTADTHFIASTGIEGQSERPSRLVKMDSLSYPGIEESQYIYLDALEMLSPTALYGVRFERGTRVVFGDRSHYLISGTASIDKEGVVLYEKDVRSQTKRVLDNVEALMAEGGSSLKDLKLATVYLRTAADYPIVKEELCKRLPEGMPFVILLAPVCRPAWLVEMECIGVNSAGNGRYKIFR